MTRAFFGPRLLSLGLVGGLAATAGAQSPPTNPQREVIRWPGGWMYLDSPGVIYHDAGTSKTGSTTVISNSANGVGNRVSVSNATPGVTILRNVRNGVGNRVTVTPAGVVYDRPSAATDAAMKAAMRWADWDWADDPLFWPLARQR